MEKAVRHRIPIVFFFTLSTVSIFKSISLIPSSQSIKNKRSQQTRQQKPELFHNFLHGYRILKTNQATSGLTVPVAIRCQASNAREWSHANRHYGELEIVAL